MSHLLIQSDARRLPLAANSIDCVITSPPYWNLRDYGTAQWMGGDPECDHKRAAAFAPDSSSTLGNGRSRANQNHAQEPYRDICGKCGARRIDSQIGLEATPEAFVAQMVAVFREVRRVLKPTGTVFLNLGDSYFSGGAQRGVSYGTSGIAPEDSQGRDCLYESLCDACRGAGQTDKAHNDYQRDPRLVASPCEPNHEHRESEHGHFPTSDFVRQADRNGVSNQDLPQTDYLESARPHALTDPTIVESSPLSQGDCSQISSDVSCQLEPPPSSRDALMSSHTSDAGEGQSHGTAGIVSPSEKQRNHTRCTYGNCSRCGALIQTPLTKVQPHRSIVSTFSHSLKPKDLVGIPWRVAFALQADGWYLRSDIIWHKSNPMPESVTDRPTKSHDYVFLLAKQEQYYFDNEAVKEGLNGSPHKPRNKSIDGFKTDQGHLEDRIWGSEAGRNIRSVWSIPTEAYPGAHFATFPRKLVEPCIKAGTSERGCCPECGAPWERETSVEQIKLTGSTGNAHVPGSNNWEGVTDRTRKQVTTLGWRPTCSHDAEPVPATVLDLFVGSGTTGVVALALKRRFIGCDLSAGYLRMAERRISRPHARVPRMNGHEPLPLFAGLLD